MKRVAGLDLHKTPMRGILEGAKGTWIKVKLGPRDAIERVTVENSSPKIGTPVLYSTMIVVRLDSVSELKDLPWIDFIRSCCERHYCNCPNGDQISIDINKQKIEIDIVTKEIERGFSTLEYP